MGLIWVILGSLYFILAVFLILTFPLVARKQWAWILKQRIPLFFFPRKKSGGKIRPLTAWGGAFAILGLGLGMNGAVLWIVLLMFLIGLQLFTLWARYQYRRLTLSEFLSFLYALPGLLEVGMPFTQALEVLSVQFSGPLHLIFQSCIRSFKRGTPLVTVFQSLSSKNPEPLVMRTLQILEVAQRKGLSLQPLVRSSTEGVEAELHLREKLMQLRKNLAGQMALAAAVPWVLGGVAGWFQPELMRDWWSEGGGPKVVVLTLLWEGLGIYFIKHSTRFY